MIKTGSVAIKLAGRDAGHVCVVLDVLDNNQMLIEGNVRRRRINTRHLEFLGKEIKATKNSSREDVLKELKILGFKFKEIKKGSKKEKTQRLKKTKKSKKNEVKVETKKVKEKK